MKKMLYISICFFVIYFSLILSSQVFAGTLSSDINGIDDSKYPQFKSAIKQLQQSNSNFTFQVYYTGIDWQEAITREYQGHGKSPMNVFNPSSTSASYKGMWYCPICGLQPFDSGVWRCASREAIEYMMDARNSLSVDSVFQFKTLETPDVSVADVTNIVAGKGTFINNSEAIQAIYDASVTYNINGYYLVAKIIGEHGNNGSSLSNGTYAGFQGIYNYFNIGAYGSDANDVINKGLKYASDKGWNTIRKSIMGGAEIIKGQYVGKGQSTLYYQKFNVVYSPLFTHQYQTNIMAAENESRSLKSYYGGNANHTFIIPVFENMPATASPRPDTNKSNSYTYEEATVNVNSDSSLNVRSKESLYGTSVGSLSNGEKIKILKRATKQVDGYYWDLIVSNSGGIYGYAAREVSGKVYLVGTGIYTTSTVGGGTTTSTTPPATTPTTPTIPPDNTKTALSANTVTVEGDFINISPDISIESLKTTYPSAVIKDTAGNVVNSGKIVTGYKATIDEKEYTLVKKGDVNGDGDVDLSDVIQTFNHADRSNAFSLSTEAKIKASQIKVSTETSLADVILIFNYRMSNR